MTKRFLGAFLCLSLLAASLFPSAAIGSIHPQDDPPKQVIPEGVEIQLSLRDRVSSKLSEPGDQIIAVVRRDVSVDGQKILREGTEVIGRVTLAQPAKRPLKGGRLHITFDRIRIDGQEQKLAAMIKSTSDFTRDEKVKSDSEGTLDGGKDGGKLLQNVGTAAGLGGIGVTVAILSGAARNDNATRGLYGIGSGAAIAGASIMGASVIAGILLTKGKEVRLDESSIIRLKLVRALSVE